MCPKIGKREKLCNILHIFLNVTRHVPLHKMRKNVCVNCCELQTELNLKNQKSELRNEKRLKRSSVFFYKETCPQHKKFVGTPVLSCSILQYIVGLRVKNENPTVLRYFTTVSNLSYTTENVYHVVYCSVKNTHSVIQQLLQYTVHDLTLA